MGRPIPEIRADMIALAHAMAARGEFAWAAQLGKLALDTYRTPAVHQAPITSRKLTVKLAQAIRDYAHKNPDVAYKEIANIFNVNQGRVSEAITHKK